MKKRTGVRVYATAMGLGLLMAAGIALAGSDEWLTDFAAAKAKAAKEGLPIVADFSGSDWCGWCIKLDKEVFSQPEFKTYASKNVVLFLADFPRRKEQPKSLADQNKSLAETYKVEGFPTVLLLDADGKVLARTGYRPGGAGEYVKHLDQLLGKKSD